MLNISTRDEGGVRILDLEGQIDGKDVYDAVGAQLKEDENDYIRIQSDVFTQEVNGNGE